MTLKTLRSIIREAGLAHAEFCIEQAEYDAEVKALDAWCKEAYRYPVHAR